MKPLGRLLAGTVLLLSACSIGGDPASVPSRYCEISEESAAARGMSPGDVVRVNDGCTPSEREVCGEFVDGTFQESPCDYAGAYVFLDEDTFVADEFWDPLLSCVGDPPCDASGSLPGVALMLSARHHQDEGWGIKVVFDPELSSEETAALVQRLTERASAAGVAPWTFLRATDLWPACAGDEDCLTVEQTLANS